MLDVSIKSIVRNLNSETKFLQPLFESITNSLEAGGRNISIKIFESEVLDESLIPQMVGFSITDDGSGFTEENIDSFCTLWSEAKIKLGCKGSGRFTWLKVYKDITITSYIKETNTCVRIPFTIDFSKEKVSREPCKQSVQSNRTTIEFKYVTDKYFSLREGKPVIDKRVNANALEIKESILDYLFITFALLKESKETFALTIETTNHTETISAEDIPPLNERIFTTEGNLLHPIVDFKIKYLIKKDGKSGRFLYLCSNKRSSHSIKPSSLQLFDNLPGADSLYFYVLSDYFDALDTDDRQGLDYYASLKDKDDVHYILYSDLLDKIAAELKTILTESYPELNCANLKVIEEIKKEKPYLASYLDDVAVTIAAKQAVEKAASKDYERDKSNTADRFAKALKNRNIDPEEFSESVAALSSISSLELCEYILYRSKILAALSPADLEDKEEFYMHNIFMPKHTSSGSKDYLSTNMWILDDKFMSYLYVSSDLSVYNINKEISDVYQRTNHDGRRPDMFLAFDREGDTYKNAVLVEFKKYLAPLDEKAKALSEVPNNIGEIRKSNKNIQTIWAYIITKLDEDFKETIDNHGGYKEIYSEAGRATYYQYNEKRNAHIFICDIDTIVKDAEVRNKVFLDIISK